MTPAGISISVTFQPTFGSLFEVLFWHNLRRSWFLAILVPVFSLAAVLGASGRRTLLAFATLFLVWATVVLVAPCVGARAAMKHPSFRSPVRYVFSESGIDIAALHSNSHFNWELVRRVRETRRFLVVSLSKFAIHAIPKSALAPGDLAALRVLLRSSVKGKLRLRS
jgi:hypothetical protein